jgi:hypothetical protein
VSARGDAWQAWAALCAFVAAVLLPMTVTDGRPVYLLAGGVESILAALVIAFAIVAAIRPAMRALADLALFAAIAIGGIWILSWPAGAGGRGLGRLLLARPS